MDLSERQSGIGRHPWELARSRFFRNIIGETIDAAKRTDQRLTSVLDIGAGDGWLAHELIQDLPSVSSIVCWDINYTQRELTEELPPRITRSTELPVGRFDVVLLLDVLEHIEHDRDFLRDVVMPALAPLGRLVFSVPAHPRLYSRHDLELGHFRRYRPGEISAMLREHFEVLDEGSLFTSLAAARAAATLVERRRHAPAIDADERAIGVGGWTAGPRVTSAMTWVLSTDARIGRHASFRGRQVPGLSYWAVCGPRDR